MNHVLIVDDTPIQLKIVISIMCNEGFQVSIANNGNEALERIRSDQPDLILLDIVMPGMDGYEFCDIVKKDNDFADIPILFLTGQSDDNAIIKAFDAGAADYVTKPVNPIELIARVKTHLQLGNTIAKLQKALAEVKRLSGMLKICSYCKNIEHEGGWVPLADYLSANSDARLTHCVCPDCMVGQMK